MKIIQRFDGKEQWYFHVTDGRFHLNAVSRGGSTVECSVNEYSDNAEKIFASNEAYDAHLGERNNYLDKHKEPPSLEQNQNVSLKFCKNGCLSITGRVKSTRSLTLVSFEWVSLVAYACQI